jgi:hypothetical protein
MEQLQAFDLLVFKEQNEGHRVMYINICNREFVFRTLGKKEYKNILNVANNEFDLEDMICQIALIYPEDFDFKDCPLGGLSKTIAPLITELSGFTNPEIVQETYDQYRLEMNSFENKAYALIKMAFPEFTFEEMEEWTWDKVLKVATKAEFILNETHFRDNPIELVKVDTTPQKQMERTEFVQELRQQGIDPMKYFWNEINVKPQYVDFPLIGGVHWQNEGILNEIRRQMERASKR